MQKKMDQQCHCEHREAMRGNLNIAIRNSLFDTEGSPVENSIFLMVIPSRLDQLRRVGFTPPLVVGCAPHTIMLYINVEGLKI